MADQPTPSTENAEPLTQKDLPAIDYANRKTVVVDINSNTPYSITMDQYNDLIATGNYRAPTPQEFRDVQYADEEATTAKRYATTFGQALPFIGWVANKVTGETDEETAQRIRDAERNLTGIPQAAGKIAHIAAHSGIDKLAAVGMAAAGVAAAPALLPALAIGGAVAGLGTALNDSDKYPGMTNADILSATMVSSAANVIAGKMFHEAEHFISHKIAHSAAQKAAIKQTTATPKEIAARQLQILNTFEASPKALEELYERDLQGVAVDALEKYGAFSKNKNVANEALDKMQDSFKAVYNQTEAALGNSAIVLGQPKYKDDLLKKALQHLENASGDVKQTFSNTASKILDDIPDLLTANQLRGKMEALEDTISKVTWKGEETSVIQAFKRDVSKMYREALEEEAKRVLPADGFAALKQANKEFIIHNQLVTNAAKRLVDSRTTFNAAGAANLALTGTGLASGNLAALLFNSIQYTAHAAGNIINNPRTMLAALRRAQGMAVNQAAANTSKIMKQAIHQAVVGASKIGAEYATFAAVQAQLKKSQAVSENTAAASQAILQVVADIQGFNNSTSEATAGLWDQNPQQQQAFAASTAKFAEVALRELPRAAVAQMLDDPTEVPEMDDYELEKAREVVDVLLDPVSTLVSAPTAKQVQLIKEVHPQLSEEFATHVLEAVMEAKEKGIVFSPAQKEQIRLWLGGGSSYEDPKFTLRLQASIKEREVAQNTPAPPRSPSAKSFSSVSSNSETPSQRVGRL